MPLTRAPLAPEQVRHDVMMNEDGTIDLTKDPQLLFELPAVNHAACDFLTSFGIDGSWMRIDAPQRVFKQQLTEAHVHTPAHVNEEGWTAEDDAVHEDIKKEDVA